MMAESCESNVDVAEFQKVLGESMVRILLPLIEKGKALEYDLGDFKYALGDQFDAVKKRLADISFWVVMLDDRWLKEMEQLKFELEFEKRDA